PLEPPLPLAPALPPAALPLLPPELLPPELLPPAPLPPLLLPAFPAEVPPLPLAPAAPPLLESSLSIKQALPDIAKPPSKSKLEARMSTASRARAGRGVLGVFVRVVDRWFMVVTSTAHST